MKSQPSDYDILNDPDAALFAYSVQLAERRHALVQGITNKRVDEFRGVVREVGRKSLTLQLDGGGTKMVPLTERRIHQLLPAATPPPPPPAATTTRK